MPNSKVPFWKLNAQTNRYRKQAKTKQANIKHLFLSSLFEQMFVINRFIAYKENISRQDTNNTSIKWEGSLTVKKTLLF